MKSVSLLYVYARYKHFKILTEYQWGGSCYGAAQGHGVLPIIFQNIILSYSNMTLQF